MRLPATNRRAFIPLLLAQFLSALGDNALLVAAIGLLSENAAPAWMTPALRICFYLAFVLLGVFAGAFADAFAKSRIVTVTNLIKLAGCALLLVGVHPLLAYALVGMGASAYAPARYGMLSELLPNAELVLANAWIEVSGMFSILAGVALGGLLVVPTLQIAGLGTPARSACAGIAGVYALASLAALAIPRGTACDPLALAHPGAMLRNFIRSSRILWRDQRASQAMAVTSVFWAIAAALQFLVLRWAETVLHLPLSQAALLQCALALGIVGGAVAAARLVPLAAATATVPAGLGIGVLIIAMQLVSTPWAGTVILVLIGILAGLLLVPMNALLQTRGSRILQPGQSIAVQNFYENLAALAVLALYGGLTMAGISLNAMVTGFGAVILCATGVMMRGAKRR
ncbi:lysophospholipid transporter LplT [Actimicrobium antarcticum]|uniref:Lysophospholipid transporter LplT n=1 Tax=Actimicrobium antarcticum TaxID=1051899 RepID=A0ABP7TIB4_9BURK